MPIYEYQCHACGKEHEILQKISEKLRVMCPSCNESALKKKISTAGFRLKGGGWYETDFKSKNKKNVISNKPTEKPAPVKKESKAKENGR